MKFLIVSAILLFLTGAVALFLTLRVDNFNSNFATSNYWLSANNKSLASLNSFEEFSKDILIHEFLSDSSDFVKLGYADLNNADSYLQYVTIPDSLVGTGIYSVKTVDGKQVVKLLNREEVINQITNTQPKYTFDVVRGDVTSNVYKILRVYIHEAI